MKLYYVEHQVVTTHRYALIAKDDEDLNKVLAEREQAVKAVKFSPKFDRDKQGKIKSFDLSKDWDSGCIQPPWEGTIK